MSHKFLFLQDTYLFSCSARVISIGTDERGPYFIADMTVFYPQGGGQPSDSGYLEYQHSRIPVVTARLVDGEVRHYMQSIDQNIVDKEIILKVDREKRLLHARYHTAGHLIGNIMDMHFGLRAVKGHHFPGEANVEFVGALSEEITLDRVQSLVDEIVGRNSDIATFDISLDDFEKQFYPLSYETPSHKKFRAVHIIEFKPLPCGGTHVKTVGEIGKILIKKIKNKSGNVKISYEV